jgi:hypothetical protein
MPTVVLTKYEDIKEVFNMEEVTARPTTAPAHKLRLGWETVTDTDPELNKGRPPGVLMSNVRIFLNIGSLTYIGAIVKSGATYKIREILENQNKILL